MSRNIVMNVVFVILVLEFEQISKGKICTRHSLKNAKNSFQFYPLLRPSSGYAINALLCGRTEFEDGLRPGSPGGVLSDNPSVCTSSLVTPVL